MIRLEWQVHVIEMERNTLYFLYWWLWEQKYLVFYSLDWKQGQSYPVFLGLIVSTELYCILWIDAKDRNELCFLDRTDWEHT